MEEFSSNAPLSAMTWIALYLYVTSVQYSKKKNEMKWGGGESHLYVARVVISSLISSVFIFFISSKVIKYFAST